MSNPIVVRSQSLSPAWRDWVSARWSIFAPFMAVSLLKMHQIFMLAFAGLRVEGGVAQVLVVSQPSPLACVAQNILGETPG